MVAVGVEDVVVGADVLSSPNMSLTYYKVVKTLYHRAVALMGYIYIYRKKKLTWRHPLLSVDWMIGTTREEFAAGLATISS